MPTPERGKLRIEVRAAEIEPGKLPVRDLTKLGELIQDGLERAARLIAQDRGIAPGPLPERVRDATELLLVGIRPGSATLELELPPPPEDASEEGRLIAIPIQDLGFRAMERFVGGLHELGSRDDAPIPTGWDNSVLEVAEGLATFATERGFDVTLDARPPHLANRTARISPAVTHRFRVRHAPIRRPRATRGKLIAVDLGRGQVDVEEVPGKRVQCEFPIDDPTLLGGVKRLLGQPVEAFGEEEFDAALNKAGKLQIRSLQAVPERVPLHDDFWLNPSAEELARQQGVGPIASIEDLAAPDIFDEETTESFLQAIRQARREQ